jgi:hypothetical protein
MEGMLYLHETVHCNFVVRALGKISADKGAFLTEEEQHTGRAEPITHLAFPVYCGIRRILELKIYRHISRLLFSSTSATMQQSQEKLPSVESTMQ